MSDPSEVEELKLAEGVYGFGLTLLSLIDGMSVDVVVMLSDPRKQEGTEATAVEDAMKLTEGMCVCLKHVSHFEANIKVTNIHIPHLLPPTNSRQHSNRSHQTPPSTAVAAAQQSTDTAKPQTGASHHPQTPPPTKYLAIIT